MGVRPRGDGNRGDRRSPRIVVVSHEASRTGAPRMAIEILRAMAPLGVERIVVHRWGGPLEPEMNAVADRAVREPFRRLRVGLRRWRFTRQLAVPVEQAAAWVVLRRWRPALVWGNTVLTASYVWAATRLRVPMVLHIHEVEPMLGQVLGRYRRNWISEPERIVACSAACADGVAARTGRPLDEIALVISRPDLRTVVQQAEDPQDLGAGFHVVVCARADRRKGVDVLEVAARRVAEMRPDIPLRCTWVGGLTPTGGSEQPPALHFVGEQAEPARWMAAADVAVLPSRADPFPLAVVEAMALGRPVIASAVGGIPEQLGDSGVLVPAGDPEALAAAMIDLYDDPRRRQELGDAARERAWRLWNVTLMHEEVRALVSGMISGVVVDHT